tara:strand:- start:27280 stop:28089 length:810 start_codon:yes stop_codon:yes gene_type:complete
MKKIIKNIAKSKFSLGEGLYINEDIIYWVDINKKKLAIYRDKNLKILDLEFTPSLIYKANSENIYIASDEGLIKKSLVNNFEENILTSPLNSEIYRSNDGGYLDRNLILGFMHKNDPINKKGFIYLISRKKYILIDDQINIPNSFIEIGNNKILISDSLSKDIWLYELSGSGELISKKKWANTNGDGVPDGGCIINNQIYIALWDGLGVGVYNMNGKKIDIISLPVIRPTNCKYDYKNNLLWITSAREGLDDIALNLYPLSGNTFSFNL